MNDAGPQKIGHIAGQRPEIDEIVHRQGVLGELADRQARPFESQRRDNGVYAGAVRQPGVDHRRAFVDAAAQRGDDLLDNVHHMGVVAEAHIGEDDFPLTLHVDLGRPVHHHLGNRLVLEQRVDRPVAQNLVHHLGDNPGPLAAGHRHRLLVHQGVGQFGYDIIQLPPVGVLVGEQLALLGAQLVDDPLVDAHLEPLIGIEPESGGSLGPVFGSRAGLVLLAGLQTP